MKTAIGLFDTKEIAERAANALENAGFQTNDVSLTLRDERHEVVERTGTMADGGAATGAVTGTVAGSLAGLLVGAGLLAIPGIGPVLAIGPLAVAIGSGGAIAGVAAAGAGLGALSGGLIGALAGAGVPEDQAQIYAEGVRRGGVLIAVHTEENRLAEAEGILRANGAVDVESRGGEYRAGGWERFDPVAQPFDLSNSRTPSSNAPSTGEKASAARVPAVASSWHDRTANSDAIERERSEDTTGLAGAPLEDSVQGTIETPRSPDRPGTTVEERMENAKAEAEMRLRNIS